MLLNYEYQWVRKGKYIFAPNDDCDRRAKQLIRFIERSVELPLCFYHYRKGGHITALHQHLENKYFFKIDIRNFFYSISRNRIASVLHRIGYPYARTFAKWSSVRNPYPTGPRFVLPIGFRQSPILASLCLMRSPVMDVVAWAEEAGAFVSIYLDDLICSGPNEAVLQDLYELFLDAFAEAKLTPHPDKIVPPASALQVFNCDLREGVARVTPERIAEFYEEPHYPEAVSAFEAYCDRVSERNAT
jgi:hypothetical protein